MAMRIIFTASGKVAALSLAFLEEEGAQKAIGRMAVAAMKRQGAKVGQMLMGGRFEYDDRELRWTADFVKADLVKIIVYLPEEEGIVNDPANIATDKGELQDMASATDYEFQQLMHNKGKR